MQTLKNSILVAAVGTAEVNRSKYETIDITVLRRGLIGVNKVG